LDDVSRGPALKGEKVMKTYVGHVKGRGNCKPERKRSNSNKGLAQKVWEKAVNELKSERENLTWGERIEKVPTEKFWVALETTFFLGCWWRVLTDLRGGSLGVRYRKN